MARPALPQLLLQRLFALAHVPEEVCVAHYRPPERVYLPEPVHDALRGVGAAQARTDHEGVERVERGLELLRGRFRVHQRVRD